MHVEKVPGTAAVTCLSTRTAGDLSIHSSVDDRVKLAISSFKAILRTLPIRSAGQTSGEISLIRPFEWCCKYRFAAVWVKGETAYLTCPQILLRRREPQWLPPRRRFNRRRNPYHHSTGFQNGTSSAYLCGLRKEDLIRYLLWYIRKPQQRLVFQS
jgi:hypothetical protein